MYAMGALWPWETINLRCTEWREFKANSFWGILQLVSQSWQDTGLFACNITSFISHKDVKLIWLVSSPCFKEVEVRNPRYGHFPLNSYIILYVKMSLEMCMTTNCLSCQMQLCWTTFQSSGSREVVLGTTAFHIVVHRVWYFKSERGESFCCLQLWQTNSWESESQVFSSKMLEIPQFVYRNDK